MPDGILPPIDTTQPELAAEATDGRLIRAVRRNLVLWSGGTTLLILVVLLVGGLIVLVVAFGFGTVYARRALVPIRESLANQRAALRRQREFAADASHELRTPLTVIRSSVDYLLRHRSEPVAEVGTAL